ncbi:hypothetical protein [Ascidiimonas aurantiaca]|uniref:hypothetical protein n=1 Tax=Ascidiimonas aurantiaca TaxID=1685432 RepID=UPI0030EB1624
MEHNFDVMNWKSAEERYKEAGKWLTELNFVCDEQQFLTNLLGEYFIKLSSHDHFPLAKQLVAKLTKCKKNCSELLESVGNHKNSLYVLLDQVEQPYEEREVKATHNELTVKTNTFFHEFKELKKNVYFTVMAIMKHDKEQRLLS